MTFDITTITIIALIILVLAVIALAATVFSLHKKLHKFLVSSNAENLGDSISLMDSSIKGLEAFKGEIETYLATVESRLKKSTQGIHTVRFNPFAGSTGSGGNQSFATAFLNEHGDGVVVSSLYAREHVSVFAKPIKNGKSDFELSGEEKEAVDTALKMVK